MLLNVGLVQQNLRSVRRMAKHMLKEFEKVSEVLNTSQNARILGMVFAIGPQ